ncbi:type I-Fv CRISPR-associated protein Cas7fv [Vibrio aestuarianus]|uniref:type I-Fv CRISPR-associated protein Cas7fv n=1 Tax=Vibrio aestuarianus TaxID=28171 RepID=UPI00237CC8A7|nr:type I-Fv CRISPR-associated protein Cas7fv [Vibrio aestuarianus]MDE1209344.1 type I-Fv CRISPR-associated protein Cas7fv [Vibrio aestuarianus]MDE1254635.1 type I-Fv CRISPR-associated protein Cas7fv [Vibrio aestuarianus]MDE1317228.1 type I-Fv CRISPR-associated protein Cas7fv [Vibrio aestuarianus]
MEKVTGIKSVDFKIKAVGHGVVNWNGPTTLTGDSGKTVDNHTLPKLRGYSNLTGKIKDETGYKYKKEATDIDFKKTPLYISQNCIRHHLFKEQAFDLHFAGEKNLEKVLASITGLVRGYVVPSSQCKRTSPLLMEDFVDQLGNGNFEQFGQAGERDSSSFFSKTTFGDTEYLSYGSISIEQLQFISLDKKFDRASMIIKEGQGEEVAAIVQSFIKQLNPSLNPVATFHSNYVRKGTIFEEGECGILLNDDAVEAIIEHTLSRIADLSIRQAKGYMYVDEVTVDYNDSHKMMRIKRNESEIVTEPQSQYAQYFYAK